jgi:2',3'-cyclic-nucleotide 2'-phosphodiesterase (5'-nucleotidase family)
VAITHQAMAADRELLGQEPRLDLILGGHEQRAQDSVVSNRHIVKADSNARSAQFVTLWGGKGKWRQAIGLVHIDNALPADTATQRVVQNWRDSLEQRVGAAGEVGQTSGLIFSFSNQTGIVTSGRGWKHKSRLSGLLAGTRQP